MFPRSSEFNLPATFALSVAASAVATCGATAAANRHDLAGAARAIESVVTNQPGSDFELVARLPLPIGRFSARQSILVRPGETTHGQETVSVTFPWAHELSNDPAATTPPVGEFHNFLTLVRDATNAGWEIYGIEARGSASDEMHEGNGPLAGLVQNDAENTRLANTRGHTAGAYAEGAAEAVVGHDIPVKYLPGREEIRPDLAADIIKLAKDMGTTPSWLLDTYNRTPERLPQAVQNMLNTYQLDRRVDLTVYASKDLPAETKTKKDSADLVPLGLLLPIIGEKSDLQTQPAPVAQEATAVATEKTANKPNFPEATVLSQQYMTPVAHRRVLPRNHNYHKNPHYKHAAVRGRLPRSRGGDRY